MDEILKYISQITEQLTIHRYLGALVIIVSFTILSKVMDISLHRIFRFINRKLEFEFDDAVVKPIRKPVQAVIFLIGCWLALLWAFPEQDSGFFFFPVAKSILILMIGYHLNRKKRIKPISKKSPDGCQK